MRRFRNSKPTNHEGRSRRRPHAMATVKRRPGPFVYLFSTDFFVVKMLLFFLLFFDASDSFVAPR